MPSYTQKICTIVADTTIRELRLEDLKTILIERKYPPTLIYHCITCAKIWTEANQWQQNKIPRPNPRKSIPTSIYPQLQQELSIRHNITKSPSNNILNEHKPLKCKRQSK